jgi:hypothetical protein
MAGDKGTPDFLQAVETMGQMVSDFEQQSRVKLTPAEQQASDSDLLEMELNYRPRRSTALNPDRRLFKTNPPGYNVLMGLGAFSVLGGFTLSALLTLVVLGQGGPQQAAALAVGLGVGLWAGLALPSRLWRSIGAGPRSLLRIPGYLGSGFILVLTMVAFAAVVRLSVALVAAPKAPATPSATSTPSAPPAPARWSGNNWQILRSADKQPLRLTLAQARNRCKALGPGWRLPTRADNSLVRQSITHSDYQMLTFHLDEPSVLTGYYDFAPQGIGWCLHADLEESKELRNVLCLKDPVP